MEEITFVEWKRKIQEQGNGTENESSGREDIKRNGTIKWRVR
jgi:hypothetical protein